MYCDCYDFRQVLLNFSKEILAKGDEEPQWILFEQFLSKYITEYTHDIELCSSEISSLTLFKLNELRGRQMALSTVLLDLMTIFLIDGCARKYSRLVWDFQEGTPFSNDLEIYRVICASRGNREISVEFTELLLNNGLLSSLSGDSSQLKQELNKEFTYFMLRIGDGSYSSREAFAFKVSAMKFVRDVFLLFEDRLCNQRMFLVAMALTAIAYNLRKNSSLAEWHISCLKMYFAGTRDAYLSVFEVRSVLYACFKMTNKLHLFDLYSEEFSKFMPECPAKMQPRKLLHLARCQIRDNLNMNRLPLLSAIDMLDLPKVLKRFLLGDILDITRNGGNVCPVTSPTLSELVLLEESAL